MHLHVYDKLFYAVEQGHLTKIKDIFRNKHKEQIKSLLRSRPKWSVYNTKRYWHFETINGIERSQSRLEDDTLYGTLLTLSCYHGHLNVAEYLVVTHQMNVNESDTYGFTPIWHAISKNHLEIVKFLIQHGADLSLKSVFICSLGNTDSGSDLIKNFTDTFQTFDIVEVDDVTPLLFAAIEGRKDIVMHIIAMEDLVTEQEKIDALEMLGVYFFYIGDDTQAFECWKQAIVHRRRCENYDEDIIQNLHRSPDNTFNNNQEHTNVRDIEKYQSDHVELCCQTVLKCERILGAMHPIPLIYMRYLGQLYISKCRYDDYINLWIYMRRRFQDNPFSVCDIENVQYIRDYINFDCRYFEDIIKLDHRMLMKFLEQLIIDIKLIKPAYDRSRALAPSLIHFHFHSEEMTIMNFLLVRTLQFITLILKKLPESDTAEYRNFYQTVCTLVKMDPRGRTTGSLLHICCDTLNWHYPLLVDMEQPPAAMDISYPKLLELLLKAGCNPNDATNVPLTLPASMIPRGETPLHVLVKCPKHSTFFEKMKILLEAGAHLDAQREGYHVQALIMNNDRFDSLLPLKYTTLMCLAARVIAQHNMIDMVPESLHEFVLQHDYSQYSLDFLKEYYSR